MYWVSRLPRGRSGASQGCSPITGEPGSSAATGSNTPGSSSSSTLNGVQPGLQRRLVIRGQRGDAVAHVAYPLVGQHVHVCHREAKAPVVDEIFAGDRRPHAGHSSAPALTSSRTMRACGSVLRSVRASSMPGRR